MDRKLLLKKFVSLFIIFLFLCQYKTFGWEKYKILPLCTIRTFAFSFTRDQLISTETEEGVKYTLPGCQEYYFPNAPRVPFITITVPLSDTEQIAFVEPSDLHTEQLDIHNVSLAKHKPLQATNGNVIPQQISNIPSFFPSESYLFFTAGTSQRKVALIKFFPLHIQGKTMFLTTHLLFSVGIKTYNNGPIRNDTTRKSVILSPDDLFSEANELKKMQRLDGISAEVVTISTIQNNFEKANQVDLKGISCFLNVPELMQKRFSSFDSDTARKIRKYLQTKRDKNEIDYLTILGDATYIPPSDYVFSLYNPDSYDRAIPTDFFYMAPNLVSDDYSLSISLGRIPVRSKIEAKQYIEKMKRYRKSNRKSWFSNVALFGGDLFEDDFYGEIQTNYMIDQGNFHGQKVTKKFQTEGLYNRETILDTLEKGNNGFMVMSSHGRGDYLRLPQGYVDSSDIVKLSPISSLPIFISDSCLNGSWDTRLSGIRYGTDKFFPYPTSFSEALLLSQGGSIAYLGGSRINYAGMDYSYENGMVESSRLYNTDALLHYILSSYGDEDTTLGLIAREGLADFIQKDMDYPGDWILKAVFGFCLLGDPTIELSGKKGSLRSKIEVINLPSIIQNNSGEIPFISLDEEIKVKVQSSEKDLALILSDYNSWEKPMIKKEKLLADEEGFFTFLIKDIKKTRLCMRIESTDGREIRFVANTRYKKDIQIIAPKTFTRWKIGDITEFSFDVVNEGLEVSEDVHIRVAQEGKVLFEKEIPRLIVQGRYQFLFPFTFDTLGLISIQYSCEPLQGELNVEDNERKIVYSVSKESTQKIGIYQYKYDGDGSQVVGKIWMDQINQDFENRKKSIEIHWISQKEIANIQEQNFDLVVLYDTPFLSDEPSLIKELESFTKKEGRVLVIGPSTKKIRSLLGIRSSEIFSVHQGDSSFQPFKIAKSFFSYFRNPITDLPVFESFAPEHKSIIEVIRDSTYILGSSNDEVIFLTANSSYYYYSGLLSYLDFERQKPTFEFFIDLLELPIKRKLEEFNDLLPVRNHQCVSGFPGYVLLFPV